MSYLDDTWPIPFGKYKLTMLKDLPADYIKALSADKKMLEHNLPLSRYIEAHLPNIEEYQAQNKADAERIAKLKPKTNFICHKITYASESDAKKHLKWMKQSDGNHKKPYRAYECPDCSGWHLTSKEDKFWAAKINK